MTTTDHEQGDTLIGAVLKQPEDWARYRVYADWLEENALTPDRSFAYRWMADRRKRPYRRERYFTRGRSGRSVPDAFAWAWYGPSAIPHVCRVAHIPDYARLPRLVFLATGKATAVQRLTWSWNAAVDLLAAALEDLREAREVK